MNEFLHDLEDEIADMVEKSFTEASNLSINEKSTLYYVSGYVARKENLASVQNSVKLPESEFTDLVSSGKLTHPPAAVYDFAQYLLSFFKLSQRKCCTGYYKRAFNLIYTMTEYNFPNIDSIIRRFINCLFKSETKNENEKIRIEKDAQKIKKQRIASR